MHTTNLYTPKYYYMGPREYIHGTTILKSFCDVLKQEGIIQFHINNLKFYNESKNNCDIIFSNQLLTDKNHSKINAFMEIFNADDNKFLYLIDTGESSNVPRKADEKYLKLLDTCYLGEFCSSSTIENIHNFNELFLYLIEINKRTHLKTLNKTSNTCKVRFVTLEKLSVDLEANFHKTTFVNIQNLGIKKASKNLSYSISELSFNLHKKSQKFLIGFAFSHSEKSNIKKKSIRVP